MRVMTRSDVVNHPTDQVALKDSQLVYRACSSAFARTLGKSSPEDIIGKTDFDFLPANVAREQLTLDSQAIYTAKADISAIEIGTDGSQAMILRTPVLSDDHEVRGLDIRLISSPESHRAPGDIPESVVTIDYQMLVNDGLQGSLIFANGEILFANENAAQVLCFDNAEALMCRGSLTEIFAETTVARLVAIADRATATSSSPIEQRLTVTATTAGGNIVRLIARVTHVQWGHIRATLLSFIDVAIPGGTGRSLVKHLAAARTAEADTESQPVINGQMVDGPLNLTQALHQLRSSEMRFQHFARSGADFFWELDARLCFRLVTEDLVQVLGMPKEQLLGRSHSQLIDHPANVNADEHWDEHLARLNAREAFRDFEFRWSVDGETKVVRYSGIPIFNRKDEFLGYRGVGCDVTAAVRQAETMAYHANHDSLTGLVNRRHFKSLVDIALGKARRERQSHALLFMDLDNFKPVNDTCGHEAGDELLRQLAQLFDNLVRKSDLLARIGGDEFGVFLYDCGVPEALKLANQIRHEVENFEFLWLENRFTVGVSIGLVVADDRWESLESLFRAADSACYIAKDEGRNRVEVYREGDGHSSNRQVATHWVEEINAALETDRLQLACQKILPLHNQPGGLRFEMLLRLVMPDNELVAPHSFLPTAERYGLSSVLDERAIELSLDWLVSNPQFLHSIRHVSINLASGSFCDPEFANKLMSRIRKSGVAADKLCFELTETATIANLSAATQFIEKLTKIGCRFSIDDFGSGLSSFNYLRKLPVDFIKIDGLLVKDIVDDPTDYTTVKAIHDISKSLGKRTVAEFVECPRVLTAVREIGIDYAQGFHIGEPELISKLSSRPIAVK